jgi:hypothetical protein
MNIDPTLIPFFLFGIPLGLILGLCALARLTGYDTEARDE